MSPLLPSQHPLLQVMFELYAILTNVGTERNFNLSIGSKVADRRRSAAGKLGEAAAVLAMVAAVTLAVATRVHAQAVPSAVAVLAGDRGDIREALRGSKAGATIIVRPGRYDLSGTTLPANIVLYAPDGATIVGSIAIPGPNTVIRGFTFEGGTVDLSKSQSVSVGQCVFLGGTTSIKVDDATNALIINNDFRKVTGGVITGWSLDRSTISGNHFIDCGQCINLDFNNDRTRGRDIVIERNVFRGTTRMPIEVGPLGAYTEDLVVRDNWAADFKNRGPDPGQSMSTFVAYSIVPTHGVNSHIVNNYAIAGNRGAGAIGIELDGSGEIYGNKVEDFSYGAVVYGAGFNVHDNSFVNATQAPVLNYAHRLGRMERNDTGIERVRVPPSLPQRRLWPSQ